MDIVDCILADHNRQRVMFAALEEARGNPDALGKMFKHLKDFLEAHAACEEKYFYPTLLKKGKGAVDSDSAEETTEDAVEDHNKIAEALEEVMKHKPDSKEWWACVDKAQCHNSEHMAEEERQGLTDFRRHVPLGERVKLAVGYMAFEAAHPSDYKRRPKDPEAYIKRNEKG